jgi:hypothetical protein
MYRLILLFLFIPLFCYSQNTVTIMSLDKVRENSNQSDVSDYELHILKIWPGYEDRSFKIKMIKVDSAGKEEVLSQPEIKADLIVHRVEYRMPDGKYEWDFITEVKSNDTWTDEYIEIGDCSNSKSINCLIRVKKTEIYKIITYAGEQEYAEFQIGWIKDLKY